MKTFKLLTTLKPKKSHRWDIAERRMGHCKEKKLRLPNHPNKKKGKDGGQKKEKDNGKEKKEEIKKKDDLVLCAVPLDIVACTRPPVDVKHLDQYVKVECTNHACPQSTWVHPECFRKYEDYAVQTLSKIGRGRGWNEQVRRANVWQPKNGFELIYKQCGCNCGKGAVRKDLDFERSKKGGETVRAGAAGAAADARNRERGAARVAVGGAVREAAEGAVGGVEVEKKKLPTLNFKPQTVKINTESRKPSTKENSKQKIQPLPKPAKCVPGIPGASSSSNQSSLLGLRQASSLSSLSRSKPIEQPSIPGLVFNECTSNTKTKQKSKNDPPAVKNKRKVDRVDQEPINEDLYNKFMGEEEDADDREGWDVVENKRSRKNTEPSLSADLTSRTPKRIKVPEKMVSSESGIKTSEHSGRISDLISPTRKQDNIFMISQPPYLTPRTLMSGISDYNTQTSTSDQINSDEDIFLSDSDEEYSMLPVTARKMRTEDSYLSIKGPSLLGNQLHMNSSTTFSSTEFLSFSTTNSSESDYVSALSSPILSTSGGAESDRVHYHPVNGAPISGLSTSVSETSSSSLVTSVSNAPISSSLTSVSKPPISSSLTSVSKPPISNPSTSFSKVSKIPFQDKLVKPNLLPLPNKYRKEAFQQQPRDRIPSLLDDSYFLHYGARPKTKVENVTKKNDCKEEEFNRLSENTNAFSKLFQGELNAKAKIKSRSTNPSESYSDSVNCRDKDNFITPQLHCITGDKLRPKSAMDKLPADVAATLANEKQGRRNKNGSITCIFCNLNFGSTVSFSKHCASQDHIEQFLAQQANKMQEEKKGLELVQNMFQDKSHGKELIKDQKKVELMKNEIQELMKYDNQECVQVNQEDHSLKVVQDRSQKISKDKKEGLMQFKSHEHTNNQSQGIIEDQNQEEIRKDESQELKQDQSQDVTKELSLELSKDQIKEGLQDEGQKLSTDKSQKLPKYKSQEFIKDQSQILVQDQSPDASNRKRRHQSQDLLQVKSHELPKDNSKELAKNQCQELSKDESQNISKDKGQELLLNNEKENKDDDVHQSNVEMEKQNTINTMILEEWENLSEKMLKTKIREAAHQFIESSKKITNDKNKEYLEKEVNCDISVTENKITQVSENLETKTDAPSLDKTNPGKTVEKKSNITPDHDVKTSVPCAIQEKSATKSKMEVSKIESSKKEKTIIDENNSDKSDVDILKNKLKNSEEFNRELLTRCQENKQEIDLLKCQKANVKKKAEVPIPKAKDDKDMTKKPTSKDPGCVVCEYLEKEVNCECDISVTELLTCCQENKKEIDLLKCQKANDKKKAEVPSPKDMTKKPTSKGPECVSRDFCLNAFEKEYETFLSKHLSACNVKSVCKKEIIDVNTKNTKLSKRDFEIRLQEFEQDIMDVVDSKGDNIITMLINLVSWSKAKFVNIEEEVSENRNAVKTEILAAENIMMEKISAHLRTTLPIMLKDIKFIAKYPVEKRFDIIEKENFIKDGTRMRNKEMKDIEDCIRQMEKIREEVIRKRDNEIEEIKKLKEEILRSRIEEKDEMRSFREDMIRERNEEKMEMENLTKELIRNRNEETEEMKNFKEDMIRQRNEEHEEMKIFRKELIRQRNEEHEEMKIFRKELIRQRNEEKEEMVKFIEKITGRKEKYIRKDEVEEEDKEIQNLESDKVIKQNECKPPCLEELIINQKVQKLESELNTKIKHLENRIEEVLKVEERNGKTFQFDEQGLKQWIETEVSQKFILEKIDDLKLRREEDMLEVKKINDDVKNQMSEDRVDMKERIKDLKHEVKEIKNELKEKMREDKVDTIRNLENVAEHLKLFTQTEFSNQFVSCKTANYAELKKIGTEIDDIKETLGSSSRMRFHSNRYSSGIPSDMSDKEEELKDNVDTGFSSPLQHVDSASPSPPIQEVVESEDKRMNYPLNSTSARSVFPAFIHPSPVLSAFQPRGQSWIPGQIHHPGVYYPYYPYHPYPQQS